MSYREESRERRKTSVRTAMDIGMGLFYSAIGGILLYAKSFGNMQIQPVWIAYILGSMLVIGGVARLYRGIKAVLPQKNDTP